MSKDEARMLALQTIVRVVLCRLRSRPGLLRLLHCEALDAAYDYDSLEVMQQVCIALEIE